MTMTSHESNIDVHCRRFPMKILEEMYLIDSTADVHFVFDNGDERQHIPAHKAILAGGSSVFDAMFFGENKIKSYEVEMVDIPIDVFQVFLQTFYCSDVDVTSKNVKLLLWLADKYDVDECSVRCETFLKNTLDESNVFQAYEIALLHGLFGLKKFCETLISLKTTTLFESDGFRKVGVWLAMRIFRLDSLSCSEFELFEACIRQIKNKGTECGLAPDIINLHIKSCFKSFRASLLSVSELSKLTSSHYDCFSYEELCEMLQMNANNIQSEASIEYQPKIFSEIRQKRKSQIKRWKTMEVTHCDRFLANDDYSCSFEEIQWTKFSTNQSVLLKGLKFCSMRSRYNDLKDFEFGIIELPKSAQCGDSVTLYGGTDCVFNNGSRVMLAKPVLIKSGFIYEIRLLQIKSLEVFSYPVLKAQVSIGPDFIVYFHPEPSNAAVMKGLIEELIFIKF